MQTFAQLILALMLILPTAAQSSNYQTHASLIKNATPSIVHIRTNRYTNGHDSKDAPYQYYHQGRLPQSAENLALGSGFIIDTKGHIVTSNHLLRNTDKIFILFANQKQSHPAKIIGRDRRTDIALLHCPAAKKHRALDLNSTKALKVGDPVLAIGKPFGYAPVVTTGIISAKGQVIGTGPYNNYLITDAQLSPSNYGGPIIDQRGRVAGLSIAAPHAEKGPAYITSADTIRRVSSDLKQHGKVRRPWAGIVARNLLAKDDLGDIYDPQGVYGVLVDNLIVDGPAYKNGLRIGDLVQQIDQKTIHNINDLYTALHPKKPGDSLKVGIYRRGSGKITLTLPLEVIPEANDLPVEKDLF